MYYMMMIKMDESKVTGPPPKDLMDAVGAHMDQQQKAGKLAGFGGLLPSSKGALVVAQGGKLTVIDGPFTEAKEVIGGYGILKAESKEEAIGLACEFMSLHVNILGAEYEGVCEVREMEAFG